MCPLREEIDNPFLKMIQAALAWSRLQSRLDIVERGKVAGGVSTIVQPVTSFDDLLKNAKILTDTFTETGTGWYVGITVPTGKRWTLLGVQTGRSTGTGTVDTIAINDGTTRMQYVSFTATNYQFWDLTKPLVLDQGWSIDFNVAAAGSSTFYVYAHVIEEDAF